MSVFQLCDLMALVKFLLKVLYSDVTAEMIVTEHDVLRCLWASALTLK